jgi:hypothetical protein
MLRDETGRPVRGEAAALDGTRNLVEPGRAWYHPERDALEQTLAEAMPRTLDEIRSDAELSPIMARI